MPHRKPPPEFIALRRHVDGCERCLTSQRCPTGAILIHRWLTWEERRREPFRPPV
jgi:hypothetical protein